MWPRNAYKDMLDNEVSPVTCVSMNHQNQLEQMANGVMLATTCHQFAILAWCLVFLCCIMSVVISLPFCFLFLNSYWPTCAVLVLLWDLFFLLNIMLSLFFLFRYGWVHPGIRLQAYSILTGGAVSWVYVFFWKEMSMCECYSFLYSFAVTMSLLICHFLWAYYL
jgi:hypothetical protein